MKRTCPECSKKTIDASQLTYCLFDGNGIQCESCKAVLILRNPNVFLQLAVSFITYPIIILGIGLAVYLSNWLVFVAAILIVFAIVIAQMYLGKLILVGVGAVTKNRGL
jgi:hypothetical protein